MSNNETPDVTAPWLKVPAGILILCLTGFMWGITGSYFLSAFLNPLLGELQSMYGNGFSDAWLGVLLLFPTGILTMLCFWIIEDF